MKCFQKINNSIYQPIKSLYRGGITMDINSIMSSQLMQLQQTVQMSVLQNAMNMETVAAMSLLEDMPQTAAPHPFKGSVIDVQA